MPIWPFGAKKNVLPSYSLLVSVPSRGLPDDLSKQEQSEDFSGWCERIQSQLLDEQTDENTPGFAIFLETGEGLLQIHLPERKGLCLLAFSTPLRAADYARVQMPREEFQCIGSSPHGTGLVVRACREQAGTTHVALDRCPRCPTFAALDGSALDTAAKVIRVWKISAATEIARTNLYRNYARSAARNGDLDLARAVALEIVGHVTSQDPLTHLLLGKLGIRSRDRSLLRDAHSFLAFLRQDALAEELRNAEQSSEWQF
jgi:hypothetical protein